MMTFPVRIVCKAEGQGLISFFHWDQCKSCYVDKYQMLSFSDIQHSP